MKKKLNISEKTHKTFEKFRAELSGRIGIVMTQDETVEWLLESTNKVYKK